MATTEANTGQGTIKVDNEVKSKAVSVKVSKYLRSC